MAIQIQVTGLNKMNGFLTRLPKNISEEISSGSGQFMKDVRKSAKLRAPRDTGRLANSIIITERGRGSWVLEVTSPYGIYQEEGFRPHAFLVDPGRPGFKSNKLSNKFGQVIMVRKNTPFIRPALEHNINKLTQKMRDSTRKGINRSRGGK